MNLVKSHNKQSKQVRMPFLSASEGLAALLKLVCIAVTRPGDASAKKEEEREGERDESEERSEDELGVCPCFGCSWRQRGGEFPQSTPFCIPCERWPLL